MSQTNRKRPPITTHEGGRAHMVNPELQLRRSVMSCMLWENEFYEDGVAIADRITQLVPKVAADKVATMAVEAREKMKLRHAPLWLVCAMANATPGHKLLVADTLSRVIQRADELAEFLSLYWKGGKCPLSAQVKKGLARAAQKFNAYQLAKYDRDGEVKLRDVLFLCHAVPKDAEQGETFAHLVNKTHFPKTTKSGFPVAEAYNLEGKPGLATPDTWETSLSDTSTEESKHDKWTRLLKEEKLGAMALLRNLRNMDQEKVNPHLIRVALEKMDVRRVLPFRFITAARHNPIQEPGLEEALFRCVEYKPSLPGTTTLLVDVSWSMEANVSGKSQVTRMDAACGVAMLARQLCEVCDVWTFSNSLVQVPARRGFALRDAIIQSQIHSGTSLGAAVKTLSQVAAKSDRLIIITDEQSRDSVPVPEALGYVINVASAENGVGYGNWLHIDGWSEAVLDFILEVERPTKGD